MELQALPFFSVIRHTQVTGRSVLGSHLSQELPPIMRYQDLYSIFITQLYGCYKIGKHYKDAYEMVFKLEDVHQCNQKTVQNLISVWNNSSEEDIREYLYPSGRSGKCGAKRKYDGTEVVNSVCTKIEPCTLIEPATSLKSLLCQH